MGTGREGASASTELVSAAECRGRGPLPARCPGSRERPPGQQARTSSSPSAVGAMRSSSLGSSEADDQDQIRGQRLGRRRASSSPLLRTTVATNCATVYCMCHRVTQDPESRYIALPRPKTVPRTSTTNTVLPLWWMCCDNDRSSMFAWSQWKSLWFKSRFKSVI